MMPKPQVKIALRTPLPTHRWDCGKRIFGVLSEVDSRLVPERIGYTEDELVLVTSPETLRSFWVLEDEDPETPGIPHSSHDTESIVGEWDDFRQGWVDFQMGSFGAALDPTIPNIGWGMIFAGDYAAEVNVDEIRAQGFPVDRMGTGWFVRVTDKLADVIDDYPHFARRRTELRRCFREDLFLITTEPGLAPSGA